MILTLKHIPHTVGVALSLCQTHGCGRRQLSIGVLSCTVLRTVNDETKRRAIVSIPC